MLTPALMLAIKKRWSRFPGATRKPEDAQTPVSRSLLLRTSAFLILLVLYLCGCAPPGPRALLRGERLIREGKYDQAIQSLQEATRLLPKNAQAYNHLGLALHGNKQFAPALAAYQKALALDHKLAAAHYNEGCLYLEQNDPAPAIEQLTSYTLLQPNSVDGWLKLGDAQVRARKIDAAEKSFKTALALHARDPEALNGLGIIQLQRKHSQDALNYFNFALAQNPNYGPALLNAGLVSHQYLNNSKTALEKYRQYLALQPRPAGWDAVSVIANHLDAELNPAPPRPASPTPAPASVGIALQASNPPARLASNHPAPGVAVANPRTNTFPTPPVPRMLAQTNQPNTNAFVIASAKATPVETAKPSPPPTPVKSDIQVTQVPEELVVKPPQEISVVRPPVLPGSATPNTIVDAGGQTPLIVNKTEPKPDKRTLFSRLNPFSSKPKSDGKETPAGSEDLSTTSPLVVATSPTNLLVAMAPPPSVPRYTYLSPPKPTAGDRHVAERFFAEGIKAQQSGKASQALAAYQKATQSDPAYFEAYYNEGLAAYALGNWKESLLDYEYALVIKPSSVDARYNFALSLQQANYPLDAADELLEILNEHPSETRAHLLLANLYARQLNQPRQARQHYLKVLETDPHHPKASEIRYWLAANP